jgi:small subunit ribosomal protein S15
VTVVAEQKKEVIKNFGEHEKDTGSTAVQVALLTQRINSLTEHFKAHKKDFNSRVGLLRLVGQRKSLLDYLKNNDSEKYKELTEKLGLKK